MMRLRRARAQKGGGSSDKIDAAIRNYRGVGPYRRLEPIYRYGYLTDLIKIVWKQGQGL